MDDTDIETNYSLNLPFPAGYIPKLSELVDLAITDLRACLNDTTKKYRVSMPFAYYMRENHNSGERCFICAAGAVMAQRCVDQTALSSKELFPSHFDNTSRNLLDAVNELRVGYLRDAYLILHGGTFPKELAALEPSTRELMRVRQSFTCRSSVIEFIDTKLVKLSEMLKEVGH